MGGTLKFVALEFSEPCRLLPKAFCAPPLAAQKSRDQGTWLDFESAKVLCLNLALILRIPPPLAKGSTSARVGWCYGERDYLPRLVTTQGVLRIVLRPFLIF